MGTCSEKEEIVSFTGDAAECRGVQGPVTNRMQVRCCTRCHGLAFAAAHQAGVQRWLAGGAMGVMSVSLQPGGAAGSLWALAASSMGYPSALGKLQAMLAGAPCSPHLASHGLVGLHSMCICLPDAADDTTLLLPFPPPATWHSGTQSSKFEALGTDDASTCDGSDKLSTVLATLEEWSYAQEEQQQQQAGTRPWGHAKPAGPAERPRQSLDLARCLQATGTSPATGIPPAESLVLNWKDAGVASAPGKWLMVVQSAEGTPLKRLLEDGAWPQFLVGTSGKEQEQGSPSPSGPAHAIVQVGAKGCSVAVRAFFQA